MSRMPLLHTVATVAMVALLASTAVRVWRVFNGQAQPKGPIESAVLGVLCALVIWQAGLWLSRGHADATLVFRIGVWVQLISAVALGGLCLLQFWLARWRPAQ